MTRFPTICRLRHRQSPRHHSLTRQHESRVAAMPLRPRHWSRWWRRLRRQRLARLPMSCHQPSRQSPGFSAPRVPRPLSTSLPHARPQAGHPLVASQARPHGFVLKRRPRPKSLYRSLTQQSRPLLPPQSRRCLPGSPCLNLMLPTAGCGSTPGRSVGTALRHLTWLPFSTGPSICFGPSRGQQVRNPDGWQSIRAASRGHWRGPRKTGAWNSSPTQR